MLVIINTNTASTEPSNPNNSKQTHFMQHTRYSRALAREIFRADVDLRTAILREAVQRPPDMDYSLPPAGSGDTTNGANIVVPAEFGGLGSLSHLRYEEVAGARPYLYPGRRGPGRPRTRPPGVAKPPHRRSAPDDMTELTAPAIPAAQPPRKGRSAPRLILGLLADVTSASALQRQAGVTRQRVFQILHEFVRDGAARCVREPGSLRYLWFRADVDPVPALRRFRKPLAPNAARVLSCLTAGAMHSMTQIAEHLALPRCSVTGVMTPLTRLQLVTRLSVIRPVFVSITAAGLAHPDRDAAATNAPTLNVIHGLGDTRAGVIEALGVLGEARSIDLTIALRTDLKEPRQPGILMHRLVIAGIAERIDGIRPGQQPWYRLTATGRQMAARIARLRPPPAREHLEAKILAYNASNPMIWGAQLRRQRLASAAGACAGAQSLAQACILRALEAGPQTIAELRPHVADLHRHRKSISQTMVTLATRGVIQQVGSRRSAKVWMLPDRGQQEGASPVANTQ